MKNKKAFTLVELIVVITILAILGTIAFLSFQGYSRDARDSVRISDLHNISRGMEFMLTKTGRLPVPEDSVEITASGTIISYQGYAGENVLSSIGVNNGGKDPKDDDFYTYVSNANYNKYQLLGFLENGDQIGLSELNQVNADLSERFPVTEGFELGVITDFNTQDPIQYTGTGIDLINTSNSYVAYINNDDFISGTGSDLEVLKSIIINGLGENCNNILSKNKGVKNKNGNYTIKNNGEYLQVYCDMTTDGGGWTLVLKANGNNTTFLYSSLLWENNVTYNEENFRYDYSEYKSRLFGDLAFDDILLELDTLGVKNNLSINLGGDSLTDLFQSGYKSTTIGRDTWKSLVPNSSLQLNCNMEGINVYRGQSHVRLGIIANQEDQCISPDSRLGIGGYGGACGQDANNSVGNEASCSPDNGDKHVYSFGYLFIR